MHRALPKALLSLFILRMLIGVFEAPSYPINNRIVTSWFPDKERATAIAIYTSGQFIGLAFLAPATYCIAVFIQGGRDFLLLQVLLALFGELYGIFFTEIQQNMQKLTKRNCNILKKVVASSTEENMINQ